jgi:hypothetical protein
VKTLIRFLHIPDFFGILDLSILLRYSNICPTRCNVTQFILSGNCSTCFGWYHHQSTETQTTVSTASAIYHTVTATCRYHGRVGTGLNVLWVAYAGSSNGVTSTRCCRYGFCVPDDGWLYHLKHEEQFTDKINCVTLHLVGLC